MFASWVGSSSQMWSRSAVVRHHPDFRNTEGWKAAHREANVPKSRYEQELREGLVRRAVPGPLRSDVAGLLSVIRSELGPKRMV